MPAITKLGHVKVLTLAVGGRSINPVEAPEPLDRDNLSMKVLADAHEDLVTRLVATGLLVRAEDADDTEGETPAE